MRILLIAPFGAGQHYWGPGISAYNLYRNLAGNKNTVSLLHGFPGQLEDDVFEEQFFIHEIIAGSPWSTVQFLRKTRIWMEQNIGNFDVVHALSAFHFSFLPAYWAQRLGVPAFVKLTAQHAGFDNESWASRLLGLHAWRLRKKNELTGYIAISKEIAQELRDVGVDEDKINLLPNGVDPSRFNTVSVTDKQHLRRELGVADQLTCLFVGGISKRKNPSKIVKAIGLLKGRLSVQLVLVGPSRESSGEEAAAIEQAVATYQLENVVIRRGHTREIEKYYGIADVFILPSDNEGMSNALLEAMASGLPVIVTDVSGTSDLVTDDFNGYIVSPNASSIAKAIELLSDGGKRNIFGQRSRGVIERGFSASFVLSRHLEIFNQSMNS